MLTPRQALLLGKVVDGFASTGQPVGSKTLAADPDVTAGPSTIRNELAVLEERGLLAHPHTAARGIVLDYEHPTLGSLKTMAQPIQFDGQPRRVALPPPLLGEHSAEVLAGYGFTAEEIASLRAAGAIGGRSDAP